MPLGRPGDGLRDSFHDLTIAHLNHELARTILCCTCNMQLSRWRRGSWVASTISESRIGTMNQRRTGARTALSASASDLIRADMAVRAPIAGSWVGGTSKIWTRIGAMNQIGTPLPALSPQGGVAAGRERGGSWR